MSPCRSSTPGTFAAIVTSRSSDDAGHRIRASGRLDRDREGDGVAGVDAAADRAELPRSPVLPEDVVALEADSLHVLDTLLVTRRRVDGVAGVLRQRDLGRRDLVGVIGGGGEVRIHLEMDVRPA